MTGSRQHGSGADASEQLVAAAGGDARAFDGLFRRYGPEAWKFASGVSGIEATARDAVTDGFAASVVAARDGAIEHPGAFRRSLLQATRVRVAERDDPKTPGHTNSPHELAAAFAALPELHRTVLWLEHVHQLRPNRVGDVAGIAPTEVVDLTRRAHHGLAVHHLSAVAATTDETCERMLRDSARSLARRLPVSQRVALRAHVSTCATCSAALAPIDDLDTYLLPLAAPFPEDLIDDARAAWVKAMTPPTSTGLSPLVERVLAAASAAAAVVAIVGASYWRGDSSSQTVAVAPVLHNVGAPIPSLDGPDIDRPVEIPGTADATTDTGTSSSSNSSSTSANPSARPPASTQGLSTSQPTVNADVGDPATGGSTTTDPAPATPTPAPADTGSQDTAGDDPAPEPAPEAPADKPLLRISLPLGSESVSVNVGGGDLIETGSSAGSTAGATGSLIDTLTATVDGLLGG